MINQISKHLVGHQSTLWFLILFRSSNTFTRLMLCTT